MENAGQSAPDALGAVHVSDHANRLAPASSVSVDVDAIHSDGDRNSSTDSLPGGFESAPWRDLQTQPPSRPSFRFLARTIADWLDRCIYGLSGLAHGRCHSSHALSHGGYAQKSVAMGYRGAGQACCRP